MPIEMLSDFTANICLLYTSSPSGQLLPYNKDSNAGLFIVRDFVTYCYTGSQTYFTPKGKEVIRMKFQKKCGEELLPKMAR